MLRLRYFRATRGWEHHHTVGNLAAAIAAEAGELLDLTLWGNTPSRDRLADEIADVLIYTLNLCEITGVDPLVAVEDKITQNEQRTPTLDGRLLPHPTVTP